MLPAPELSVLWEAPAELLVFHKLYVALPGKKTSLALKQFLVIGKFHETAVKSPAG